MHFRRRLGVPNPIHHFNLCTCLITNRAAILAKLATTNLCRSRPTRYPTRARAVVPQYRRSELFRFQARARAGARAILNADIADFYPSVYTHSIPWAFHTKAVAKANRTRALFGNVIDEPVRGAQDGQTMGVPIGPDTSFIIAESILADIDTELVRRMPSITGWRWIDEYELTFASRASADSALAEIQNTLLDYELRLNPRKTVAKDLPVEFQAEWVKELRAFRFRRSTTGQASDLIRYFDYMTEFVRTNPNEHIVKYALARLRTFRPHPSNRDLFQSLICQAVASEPAAIREGIECMHYAESNHGLVFDGPLWSMTLNLIIEQNAPLGHEYEVVWCLWACLTWTLQISRPAAEAISNIENSIVAILALDANAGGLFAAGGLDTTRWSRRMATNELYEEEWLLAYEANVQGWLPSTGGGDHVAADPNFAHLKNSNVQFYIPTTIPILAGALAYP
ncbi:MAG: reverse transcriptase domain-containing protein [Terriglobales bacterium]